MSPRRVFWWGWAVFTLLTAAWAVANPLMASPDEPAHVVKAAAVARGQILGEQTPDGTVVEVPYFYNLVTAYPVCYQFNPEATGNCDWPATQALDEPVRAVTPAGRYNPLYYAVVGLPTLAPPGDGVLYAMRILSGAWCAFFVAAGLRALAEVRRPAWPALGAGVALTPMVVFLASSVNPAGIEIAAAFALWCQLLVLLRRPDPDRDVTRLWWIAAATLVVVNARGLSLVWTGLAVLAVVALTSWAEVRRLLARRATWPAWAAIVVSCLVAAAWVVGTNSMSTGGEPAEHGTSFLRAFAISVFSTDSYVINMIGQFGWLDTYLETWVYLLWGAVFGLVGLLALAAGHRRERRALLALGLAVLAVPVLIHAWQAPFFGIIWQGRYVLPLAVGLPLAAAAVLQDRLPAPARVPRNAAALGIALLTVVQGAAFVENLHRYVNGEDGAWTELEPDAWLPPVPLGLVLALGAVAVLAFGAYLLAVARRTEEPVEADPVPAVP